MITLGVVVALVAILVLLIVESRAGTTQRRAPRGKDITTSITLSAADEAWLLAGRPEWPPPVEDAWARIGARAERYETKAGATRLRIQGLGPDEGEGDALYEMLRHAHRAAGDSSRKEDASARRRERLEGAIHKAFDDYAAKHHWHVEMDADERASTRRSGGSWRDFRNG